MENSPAYDSEKVVEILRRVKGPGGLPLTQPHIKCLAQWYKTLASRGHTTAEFVSKPENVSTTYKEKFPNPHSRGQFARGYLAVIGGMTDDEFHEAYPNLTREGIVSTMRKIISEAYRESKVVKCQTHQNR